MGIWALASATAWGQPVQTFTIGLGGESWESGGASIDPEILRKRSE